MQTFKTIIFLLLFALTGPPWLCAQSTFTISGYVRDGADGEALPGATIAAPELGTGTYSNDYGFFSLQIPADTVTLRITYVGYSPLLHKFEVNRDTTFEYEMQVAAQEVGEVVIVADQADDLISRNQMSYLKVPIEQVKSMPMLLGEVDILKALQLMPGVQSGSEGGTGIYVRGGGPDQNLVLLDEAPVYNASHMFGFFSIFNGDAINGMELYKAGFPAKYGGRLSSVLDVKMKEGNRKKLEVSGGIGLISSRLTVEGPIVKDKASFMLSGRRTYLDLLTRPLNKLNEGNKSWQVIPDYSFHDVNAKLNFDLGKKDKLYLSGYFGKDIFRFIDGRYNFDLLWGNTTGTLRWNHLFNDELFLNTTLVASNYDYNIRNSYVDYEIKLFSNIRDLTWKADFDWFPRNNHFVRFGARHTQHKITPRGVNGGTTGTSFSFDQATELTSQESAVYFSDDISFGEIDKLNLGLRVSSFWVPERFYVSPEPRISYLHKFNDTQSFKASYSRMTQYIHLISNSAVTLPTDLWYPTSARTKPQLSDQVAVGYNQTFLNGLLEFNTEAFGKYYQNLVEYSEGAQLFFAEDVESQLTYGRGWSYGGEVFLNKRKGDLTGWLGYTLSWTYRQFPEINGGQPYPNKYDRRHDVSLVVQYKLSPKWTFSGNWIYGTGNALTLSPGRYYLDDVNELNGGIVPDYVDRNSFRMPAYHRLDLAAIWNINPEKGHSQLVFSLYNAYSRWNTYFIYFEPEVVVDRDVSVRFNPRQVSLFPVIPAFTYNFRY